MHVGKHKENFQLSNQHELLDTKHLRLLRAHDYVGIHSKDVILDAWKFLSQLGRTSFQVLPRRSSCRSQPFFPFEVVALAARDVIWGEGRVHAAIASDLPPCSPRGSTGDSQRCLSTFKDPLLHCRRGRYTLPVPNATCSHWRLVCTGSSLTVDRRAGFT